MSTATLTDESVAYRWKIPGMPHRGWRCVGVVDLNPDELPMDEVEYETCEVCGQHPIRFVHTIVHDDCPESYDVGCVCVEHLTEDYVNPRKREDGLRNKAKSRKNRRARWLARPWRTSRNGNPWLRHEGRVLIVFENQYGEGWKGRIDERISRRTYPTIDAAKLAIFDAIEWLKARNL